MTEPPPPTVPWDKDYLASCDAERRAADADAQFDADYAAAALSVQRVLASAAGAHAHCPLRRCRRMKGCRTRVGCVVRPMPSPSEDEREAIETVYEDLQRRRMQAATRGEG